MRYLNVCPKHVDTPAVDCLVCEPVDSGEDSPVPAVDPWLHASPWAPAVLTDEAVDRIADDLFMVTAAEAMHAEAGGHGPAFTKVQYRTDHVRQAVRTALETHMFPHPAREERPEDDPAPKPTCNGRDCGGYPHD